MCIVFRWRDRCPCRQSIFRCCSPEMDAVLVAMVDSWLFIKVISVSYLFWLWKLKLWKHSTSISEHLTGFFVRKLIYTLSTSACLVLTCVSIRLNITFRSSSESRTTRRVSLYKRLDGQTSTRCSRRCTVCLLNSASTIAGRADVQDSADVISAVSESAHLVAHQCTPHSIVVRPTAVRAISTDIICQTIFQHYRTSDLELTATCRIKLRLSLYFQIKT